MKNLDKSQSGFSLLEMSLVLMILGVLFSAFLPLMQGYLRHKKILEACEIQHEIRQTLLNFSIVYGRLPWAANAEGIEQTGQIEGGLPWRTLGLYPYGKSYTSYHYQVLKNWADDASDPAVLNQCDIQKTLNYLSVNFCSQGSLSAKNLDGRILYDKAVAVVSLTDTARKTNKMCEVGVTWLSAETVLGGLVMAGRLY